MKISEMKTADQIHEESYRTDPKYRAEWDRTAFAHQVALAVLGYRTERGLTQAALARQVGMTQPVIARLEAGDQPPSIATLAKLTAGTGLELNMKVADGQVNLLRLGARTAGGHRRVAKKVQPRRKPVAA
jgi:ribosome-binding protein aMBF1 (putative translation factor)